VASLYGNGYDYFYFLGRKGSQSPSPSRTTSPSRSLSPSANRPRDRSVSPLRYINLPISKLERVTEELEHLINAASSTNNDEEREETEEQINSIPQDESVPHQSIDESALPTSSSILPTSTIDEPVIESKPDISSLEVSSLRSITESSSPDRREKKREHQQPIFSA
jgi:hypothetical protein